MLQPSGIQIHSLIGWVQNETPPISPPTDHLVSHDSRDLRDVDVMWNPTPTVVQHKGPHYTYIMYGPPVLFHVFVLSTICLHLISTCSVGHDPRDILDDGSIHLMSTYPWSPWSVLVDLCRVLHSLRCTSQHATYMLQWLPLGFPHVQSGL